MRALLSLGGNIGDPRAAMTRALHRLDGAAGTLRRVSRLYRTPPWGRTDQPDFLNCCAWLETDLVPEALLKACLEIEMQLHRVRDARWGPRTIDIDIVDFAGQHLKSPALQLPHPHAHERAFVLLPLLEIAPDVAFDARPAHEWLSELDASNIAVASVDGSWWLRAD